MSALSSPLNAGESVPSDFGQQVDAESIPLSEAVSKELFAQRGFEPPGGRRLGDVAIAVLLVLGATERLGLSGTP